MGNSPHAAHAAEDDGDYGLAAFDVYQPWAPAEPDVPAESTFTVTNPPGTVTVSAFFDGRVDRVELSPDAAEAGEEPLAAEIVVIAGLATQRARAAQFSYMLEGMQDHGHDTVDARDSWPVLPAATTTIAPLMLTAKLIAAPTVASSIGRVDL